MAFKWQDRFITAQDRREPLEGIMEMHETYVLKSEKGSRGLRQGEVHVRAADRLGGAYRTADCGMDRTGLHRERWASQLPRGDGTAVSLSRRGQR